MNTIKKIMSAPFILGILLIAHNWFAIKRTLQFIRWGGEFSLYDKDDSKTIQDLYKLLKQMQENNKDGIN